MQPERLNSVYGEINYWQVFKENHFFGHKREVKSLGNYRLFKQPEGEYVTMTAGIRRKTLVHGDKTILCKFKLDQGTLLPLHSHRYEQTGYLLAGSLVFTIDGEKHEVKNGDSWSIKAGVEHGAEVVEDTTLIEVFSPLREDYL